MRQSAEQLRHAIAVVVVGFLNSFIGTSAVSQHSTIETRSTVETRSSVARKRDTKSKQVQ